MRGPFRPSGVAGATLLVAAVTLTAAPLQAQNLPTGDPVLEEILREGTEQSRAWSLAQTLMDSLGPRLVGTPESDAAARWMVDTYASWGVDADVEEYGTWRGWQRGFTHVDLVEPRPRTLDAMLLAWSPGTDGPVTGAAVTVPAPGSWEGFLDRVEGRFVLLSAAEPTCRPDPSWEEWATEESFQEMREARTASRAAWRARIAATGMSTSELSRALEEAGAAGIVTSSWSRGWGVRKVFDASTTTRPHLSLSCEDYGLVFRMAEQGQGPVLRVDARAEDLGEVPVGNVIAAIPGTERPDEYVVLSAHMDSWDGGTGATDNGTGTVVMMEAMRILAETYPRPRRTILAGHWNGEEQGLNGSRAFAEDHPEVVDGLQALFNQDNGTGRVARISMQGLPDAAQYFAKWFSRMPDAMTRNIDLIIPGRPGGGGSDYASFVCEGAPAFSLSSLSWDYGRYTWHTDLDTFDKIAMDDLVQNAVLTAMLAYQAAAEEDVLPRTRRVMPEDPATGEPRAWPSCRRVARSSG